MRDSREALDLLERIFTEAKSKHVPCNKFYCSTCGGLAESTDEMMSLVGSEDIVVAFMNPEMLPLGEKDFSYFPQSNGKGFVVNLSQKLIFLIDCFKGITLSHGKLIDYWLGQCERWDISLFDFVSYYLVSNCEPAIKARWKLKIDQRIMQSSDLSLIETKKLKFEGII